MAITFGTRDMLEYDAKYGVLICRECKYAVQKSALGSHLLRHKIYREERRRLLSAIARLEILEPDDVQRPLAGSPPVDGLPIISGYRCTATGCESLYASSKRVRRHWSETHGLSDPPDSFAHSAYLQTFFRGTKLRYFEVMSPEATAGTPLVTSDGGLVQQRGLNPVATHAPREPTPVLLPGPPCDLDLETMRYLHHFMTTTSLTLPAENHGPAKHWQMDVVAQALRLRWLMCGLLAISASHLSVLSDNEMTEQVHRKRSAHFFQGFSAGWEEVKRGSGVAELEEVKMGAQITCIQRFFDWRSESPTSGPGTIPEPAPFQLQSFTSAVQGCVDPNIALRSTLSSDEMPGETFVWTRHDLGGSSDAGVPHNAPLGVLERFRALPYRMAEVLEKPDSVLDFSVTLAAIDALVECYSLSYASDDVRAVWMGMELWLRRLSDHFNRMVCRRSSAALIVLAHWSLLVERAERHCWFLKGWARKVLRQTAGELPKDSAVQSLVENLVN